MIVHVNRRRGAAVWHCAAGILMCFGLWLSRATMSAAEPFPTNDYSGVDALFTKHCLECHEAKDPEANLVLESFDSLMKGSENGPVIAPGKSAESLLASFHQAVKTLQNKVGFGILGLMA